MANPPNSLAYNVESLVIELLRAGGVIPANFAIYHESDTARSSVNRIIVTDGYSVFDGW